MVVRIGSWHARHICPSELSRTRKLADILSMDCTWGLWHEVHSTLSFSRCTAPVLSPVLPAVANVEVKWMLSCSGLIRLKGCELCRLVPNWSPCSQLPLIGTWPNRTVSPTATVPSWQLRHSPLALPSGICWLALLLSVELA